jgi:hypothetical protein
MRTILKNSDKYSAVNLIVIAEEIERKQVAAT